MKFASIRVLALASLASLAMATSSSAVPITLLQYTQTNTGQNQGIPADVIFAQATGSSTTLTTQVFSAPSPPASGVLGAPMPILITQLGGAPVGPVPLPGFMQLIGVTSTGTATASPGGEITQLYEGQIRYTSPTGTLILNAAFTNAVLSGTSGGGLRGSDLPPQTLVFTSGIPTIQALIDANPRESFGLSFSGIEPPLAIVNGTIANFRTVHTGTYSVDTTAVIPEPSGIVMAGTAIIAGLGCLGWRRRQSSRA